MPKLSKFKKALRLMAKAQKHFWLHYPASAHIPKSDKNQAFEFRMETRQILSKRGKMTKKAMPKKLR